MPMPRARGKSERAHHEAVHSCSDLYAFAVSKLRSGDRPRSRDEAEGEEGEIRLRIAGTSELSYGVANAPRDGFDALALQRVWMQRAR
jgi:hypothetical protein